MPPSAVPQRSPASVSHLADALPAAGVRYASIQTASYSGATLLCFMLASHPDVASVGEVDGLIPAEDPDLYLCSCGEPVRVCAFWSEVAEAMAGRGEAFDPGRWETRFDFDGPRLMRRLRAGSLGTAAANATRDRIFQALPWERPRWERLTRRNEAFARTILAVSGKRVLVDSSKDGLRLAAFRNLGGMPVSAIHLVRDVRGVVASRLRRGVPISAGEAARQWLRLNRRIEANLAGLPPPSTVRIRYEDLCRDPAPVLAAVHRAIGVVPSPPPADFRSTPHHIIGNVMRLGSASTIEPDESWRSFLTPDQIAAVDAAAGDLRARYGYP